MQQDGATAHTAEESLSCLQQHFGDHLISRGPVTATTVDAARRSYSPHGGGVTCLSATTLWRSLNFPWTCHCDNSACSKMELQPIQRGSHLPVCNNTFGDHLIYRGPVTATTVDAARWSYSPHGGGVTCLSATTLWRSLNFLWTCHCDNSGCSKTELQPTRRGSHLPVCNNTLEIT